MGVMQVDISQIIVPDPDWFEQDGAAVKSQWKGSYPRVGITILFAIAYLSNALQRTWQGEAMPSPATLPI
jgi:hypothetical protein